MPTQDRSENPDLHNMSEFVLFNDLIQWRRLMTEVMVTSAGSMCIILST